MFNYGNMEQTRKREKELVELLNKKIAPSLEQILTYEEIRSKVAENDEKAVE
jgi:hypothetical protein